MGKGHFPPHGNAPSETIGVVLLANTSPAPFVIGYILLRKSSTPTSKVHAQIKSFEIGIRLRPDCKCCPARICGRHPRRKLQDGW
jgi:hypothetical protein